MSRYDGSNLTRVFNDYLSFAMQQSVWSHPNQIPPNKGSRLPGPLLFLQLLHSVGFKPHYYRTTP